MGRLRFCRLHWVVDVFPFFLSLFSLLPLLLKMLLWRWTREESKGEGVFVKAKQKQYITGPEKL